jgi:ribosomal protein S18 acetylase RimI-like enzyme
VTHMSQEPNSETTPLMIRPAREADLPSVVALLAADSLGAGREVPPGPNGKVLDPAYGKAFAAMSMQGGNELLVAEIDGAVVGCLQFTVIHGVSRRGMSRAQIEGVRVASSQRGQQVGQRLMAFAIERARSLGCGLVQLTTDQTRPDAHRFYERLGFKASHIGMKLPLD